jgi:hypothetical protein
MKFMISLLMAVLPALSFAQSQSEAGQGVPSAAPYLKPPQCLSFRLPSRA